MDVLSILLVSKKWNDKDIFVDYNKEFEIYTVYQLKRETEMNVNVNFSNESKLFRNVQKQIWKKIPLYIEVDAQENHKHFGHIKQDYYLTLFIEKLLLLLHKTKHFK